MNTSMVKSRTASFLIIFLIYITAGAAAYLAYDLTSGMHILISTLLADIAATIVVWLCGIFLNNSSVYDPYWSAAPIFILISWIFVLDVQVTAAEILFITAILVWGVRLTLNWAVRWKGMGDQDWRYTMFKRQSPGMWFLTNLFGINLMPTLIVFIALTPLYFALVTTGRPVYFAIPGFMVCIAAVTIQATSDRQMDIFKKDPSSEGKHIDCGLWKYSRHPNYLGEISFWWGIWLMQVLISPSAWYTVIGPVLMTLLFLFVSIPLMERHILETRPGYRNYQRKVPVLRLFPLGSNDNK
jgi:steroid 5-alpha reductase family enzyme